MAILDRNALRTQIRQKLQQRILATSKPREDYSIGGFFKTVGSEAGEIVRGIGSLLGIAGKAIVHPIETAQFITSPEFPKVLKQVGSSIVESYKGYKEPLKKFYNEPIGVVTDALTVATLGGAALTKVGTAAKIPELAKAGEIVSAVGKPIALSKDLAKFTISKIPGGPEFLTSLEQRAKTIETLSSAQRAHLVERNKTLAEVDTVLSKLTPEERQTLIPFTEKRVTLPFTPSENFNKAVQLVDKLAKQREALIGPEGLGKLTAEQIEARKWQPILKQLYGDSSESLFIKGEKITDDFIKSADINELRLELEGIETTLNDIPAGKLWKYANKETGELPEILGKGTSIFGKRGDQFLDELYGYPVDESIVFKDFEIWKKLREEKRELVQKIKDFRPEVKPEILVTDKIAEAKKLLGFSDSPMYVQHIFDDKPKKFTDFFVNTAPVKSWKPGFLKRSKGVSGYSVDANEVLKWEAAQTLKYKNNIDLLNRVKNLDFVEPLDDIKNLKPGYKVFAPDGYIRFYQGTIDLAKEFGNKIKGRKELDEISDIWDDLKGALDSSLLEKKYVGVTSRVKLYQVPDASANILQAYTKTVSPYIRLFWDKPVDAFRFLALALTPRWLVNNVVGNTIFSIVAGDPLSPAGYLTYRTAKESGLIPDDVFSGFFHTEKLMSGKLGRAAETKLGGILKIAGETVSELPVIKQVKQLGNVSYRVNTAVDDFFRGTHYINVAIKEAKKKVLQETGNKLNKTIELLQYAKQDPEIIGKAVKSVEDFFYGASKLSPFERQYVRRFLPFYSWYKFISLYSLRLPLEHPARFEVISNLAKTFYDITGQTELPNYLKGSVPIGETKEGDIYYLRTSGLNPFGLLEDIATQGVSQTALSSVTPAVKTGIERATGREAFTGRTFTAKDIIETYNGRLYMFNQKTGKVEEVSKKVLPSVMEHLLRNFVPQYQLMEQAIIGGAQQYTAAGLPSLISGKGVKVSSITGEPKKPQGAFKKLLLRGLGLLGIPVSLRTGEQQQFETEGLQRATTQFFGQQNPILSPSFKGKLKDELRQRILNDIQQRSIIEGIF